MAIGGETEYFRASLGEFADIARSYGVAKPLRKIAKTVPNTSLSTLKKLMNGEHIRPKQFRMIARAIEVRALDWIELKIRYSEAYLQEYLVKNSEHTTREEIACLNWHDFFARRMAVKNTTHQIRLSKFIGNQFQKAGATSLDIADKVGESKIMNMWTVSKQTVDAFKSGQQIRPQKLKLIRRRLGLSENEWSHLKILYSEAYLSESMIGSYQKDFERLTFLNYPRTSDVLTFSTQNPHILA